MKHKQALTTFLFLVLAGIATSPSFVFAYEAGPSYLKPLSYEAWVSPLDSEKITFSSVEELFPPLNEIKLPEAEPPVFNSTFNVSPNWGELRLSHEKGRLSNWIQFSFSIADGGAQSVGPYYRIERGPYWQRPWEVIESPVSFLKSEIPQSWKKLGVASEVAVPPSIYHFISGETRLRLTDRTQLRFFYEGSDYREDNYSSTALSRYVQGGGELDHRWTRWLGTQIGYNAYQDSSDETSYSSRTTTFGPHAAVQFSLPAFRGHFKGSSIKFFGSLLQQDWVENRELGTRTFIRESGVEAQWKLTERLSLTSGVKLSSKNEIWQGESYVSTPYRTYFKLERDGKWGKLRFNMALDTPLEYRFEDSQQKKKFERGLSGGLDFIFRKRFELGYRHSVLTPYPSKTNLHPEHPFQSDVQLKYRLGPEEHDPAFRIHGGYLSPMLSEKSNSSAEATLDGAFIFEF